MIDLTPLEVRKKKGDFRRGLRGYEPPQVDEFLDIVADRLEAVVRENITLTERLTRLEQQVTDYRDREKALTDALVTAQEMREAVRAQASQEADLAKRQAEQEAQRIRTEAASVREREEETLRRLRARQLEFLQTYRSFLQRELAELASMARGLELNGSMTDLLATKIPTSSPSIAPVEARSPQSAAAPTAVPPPATAADPPPAPTARRTRPADPPTAPPPASPAPTDAEDSVRAAERTVFAAGVAGASFSAAAARPRPPAEPASAAAERAEAARVEAALEEASAELILSDEDVLRDPDLDSDLELLFGAEEAAASAPPPGDPFGEEFSAPSGADAESLELPEGEPEWGVSSVAEPKPVTRRRGDLGLDLVPEHDNLDFEEIAELGGSNDFGIQPDLPSAGSKRPVADPDDPEDLLSSLFEDDR